MITLHHSLFLFLSCILPMLGYSVSMVPADRVTGGRCLWSLLPLNGRGGLNQLSVNRFCWEVNRVEGNWSRVVSTLHCYSFLLPVSPAFDSPWCPAAPAQHSSSHIASCHHSFSPFFTFSRIIFLLWTVLRGRGQTEWPMGRDGVSKHVMYPPLVQYYQQPHSPRHHGNPLSDKLSET